MKRRAALVLCAIAAFITMGIAFTNYVYADCNGVSTVLIQCDNNENGIMAVLNLIINILTILVGILAAIGIVVVGLQYLTAGDNVEQTRKAKRRLLEIVIGLAAYALLYTGLSWLSPGFSGNSTDGSGSDASSGMNSSNDGGSSSGSDPSSSDEPGADRQTGSEDANSPQGIRGDGSEGWIEEE